MRILQLAQFYPPVVGGEERHVRNLAGELARRGHEVHVACLEVPGKPPEQAQGVAVHALPNVGAKVPALYPTADRPLALPAPDPLASRALKKLVDEVRPDVVHAHNWILNSYLPLRAARRLPLVYSLHDYSHLCPTKRLMFEGEPCSGPAPRKCFSCTSDWYGTGRGPVIQSMVSAGRPVRNRVVDLFTPVSTFVGTANQLDEQGVPWQVVPNFVPDALTSRPLAEKDPALPDVDYLFFAGDLSDQKGVPTLLAAFRRLDPPARPAMVLVGNPSTPLGDLPADVHLGDKWEHDRVVSGFQHALAAVLPSIWPDPCPTTVLEAMALGTPIVTTPMGGIADMVTDGDSALVVTPGDVGATETALRRLVGDAELRARLVAGAKERVRPYLQSAVADTFTGIYEDLAGRHPSRP